MSNLHGRSARLAVLVAAWIAPVQPAAGDEAPAAPDAPVELRHDAWVSVGVIAGSAGVFAAIRAFELQPEDCRWCERSDLNRTDRWVRDSVAELRGDAMAAIGGAATGLIPIAAIGLNALSARRQGLGYRDVGVDALVVLESAAAAAALTAIAKASAGRQRPYTLDLPTEEVGRSGDENASFFSGHTALGFSVAVSAGMVASMRRYRAAPAVWAVGLSLATVAGFSRLTSDEHFFTDLAAGAVAGSAAGVFVPWTLHRPQPIEVAPAPIGDGHGLAVRGWF